MISLKEVLIIHQITIEKFGGSTGIRDLSLLKAALDRPNATFDGVALYSNPIEKAASIIESIINNHPFTDGNKRTGYVLMRLLLLQSNLDIKADEEAKFEFVMSIAKGELDFEMIKNWISENTKLV